MYILTRFCVTIKAKRGDNMDLTSISQLIGTVGFPIVCCIYLIYTNGKNGEKHDEEIEKLRETIDNNTKAMMKLCAKLGVDYGE